MKLRKLEKQDAPYMLEWMHDLSVIRNLRGNFASMQIGDCIKFIELAQDAARNLHLAIVNDRDEYQGTVSLKHICEGNAEFAIVLRKSAMGKGFSEYGMREILHIAFEKLGLDTVYWCVSPENKRACRFYDRQQYERFNVMEQTNLYSNIVQKGYLPEQIAGYYWYQVVRKVAEKEI